MKHFAIVRRWRKDTKVGQRLFLLLMLLMMTTCLACARDEVTTDTRRLPEAAQTFLAEHFPTAAVTYIKIDHDFLSGSEYTVRLADGTEVDFDKAGQWTEVDCGRRAVPAALVPDYAVRETSRQFPQEPIVKVERKRGRIEVELANDLSFRFDRRGRLVEVED